MCYCRSGGLLRVGGCGGGRSRQHSLHALLQDGVPPGLADDEVSPLDDDDAGEEGRVAGVLYNFSALVRLGGEKKKSLHTLCKTVQHAMAPEMLSMSRTPPMNPWRVKRRNNVLY